MATLEASRGGDDLLRRRSRDLVEEREEVFVEEMALGIGGECVVYLSESVRVSPCTGRTRERRTLHWLAWCVCHGVTCDDGPGCAALLPEME
jgi:hypothetical protein